MEGDVAQTPVPKEPAPGRREGFVDELRDDAGRRVRPVIAALAEKRARHKQRHIVVRGLYLAVAFTVLLLGVIMLITPGPAFVIIPIGLTLLALEFASAERLLDRALDQADAAKAKARETTKTQRLLVITASVLGIAALAAATWYWDLTQYLPF